MGFESRVDFESGAGFRAFKVLVGAVDFVEEDFFDVPGLPDLPDLAGFLGFVGLPDLDALPELPDLDGLAGLASLASFADLLTLPAWATFVVFDGAFNFFALTDFLLATGAARFVALPDLLTLRRRLDCVSEASLLCARPAPSKALCGNPQPIRSCSAIRR